MAKIHFFSGSFDPPHLGHREIARISSSLCDTLLVFPTRQSPAKDHIPHSSDSDRMVMSRLNFSGIQGLEIDEFEMTSVRQNFTINTVHYLQERFPGDELTLVLGKDQWADFYHWYQWQEILNSASILCFHRDSVSDIPSETGNNANVKYYSNFHFHISSSEIRVMLLGGNQDVINYLSPEVYTYIISHNLYR